MVIFVQSNLCSLGFAVHVVVQTVQCTLCSGLVVHPGVHAVLCMLRSVLAVHALVRAGNQYGSAYSTLEVKHAAVAVTAAVVDARNALLMLLMTFLLLLSLLHKLSADLAMH